MGQKLKKSAIFAIKTHFFNNEAPPFMQNSYKTASINLGRNQ
tara:strand:+ start:30986 stop:31111 length:126 start_codon:yes stop_codon:yes gene_type:complete